MLEWSCTVLGSDKENVQGTLMICIVLHSAGGQAGIYTTGLADHPLTSAEGISFEDRHYQHPMMWLMCPDSPAIHLGQHCPDALS